MTRQGKRRTNPSGIDIDEFPFSRIRRRRNDNLGSIRPFSREKSSRDGRLGEEGIRFVIFCTSPMDADVSCVSLEVVGAFRSETERREVTARSSGDPRQIMNRQVVNYRSKWGGRKSVWGKVGPSRCGGKRATGEISLLTWQVRIHVHEIGTCIDVQDVLTIARGRNY